MTEERKAKFLKVIRHRQADLTVILENIRDHHNVGAVLRTCDSVGIREIFILQTDPFLQKKRIMLGKRTSAGTRKWVDVHYHTTADSCFEQVRATYQTVYTTHLTEDAQSLYELDLTQSVALLFGNEHLGVSAEALAHSDGNFTIPQVGMAASLNISVACAVSVYEAFRQRSLKGFYSTHPQLSEARQNALFNIYNERSENKTKNKSVTHPNLNA